MPVSGTASASHSSRKRSSFRRSGRRTRRTSSRRSTSADSSAQPERESSVKEMISRVAGTITGWGRAGGYFATEEDAPRVQPRAHPHPAAPDGGVQLARLVQRRIRGEPAVQRVLHPQRRRHDGVDPRLEHEGGDDLPRRLGLGDQPVEHPWLDGAAREGRHGFRARVVHARSGLVGRHDQVGRQDAPGGQDGRARRRPPGYPRVHLVQGEGGGQGGGAARRGLRHVDRRRRASSRSSTRTPTTRSA